MKGLENTLVQCPYCWEEFETVVDCSSITHHHESQQYTEDCYICCRPIVLTISIDETDQLQVQIEAELTN